MIAVSYILVKIRNPRYLAIFVLVQLFLGCGVYQAAKYESSTQGYSVMIMLNPITAVTGVDMGPSAKEIEESFPKDCITIRNRNIDEMTYFRNREISRAMGRAFRSNEARKMTREDAKRVFGPPDAQKETEQAWIFIYRTSYDKYHYESDLWVWKENEKKKS